MKIISKMKKRAGMLKYLPAILLMIVGWSVSAQQSVFNTQTGVIRVLLQDDGIINISDVNFAYQNDVTKVFLNGEITGAEKLTEGMVVRYRINGQGVLTELEIIGPVDKVRLLDQH